MSSLSDSGLVRNKGLADQLRLPNVYIEKISSGARTITSVATSITAFFGRAVRGPLKEATTITRDSDFERTFGQVVPSMEGTSVIMPYPVVVIFPNASVVGDTIPGSTAGEIKANVEVEQTQSMKANP